MRRERVKKAARERLRNYVINEMRREDLTSDRLLILNGAKDVLDFLRGMPMTLSNQWLHNLSEGKDAGWYGDYYLAELTPEQLELNFEE